MTIPYQWFILAHKDTWRFTANAQDGIIDVQEAKGREHDFKVYKDTIGKTISNSIPLDADLGYQGIAK